MPRSAVRGFSSPAVSGGEQVLSVEAVHAGLEGQQPSPQEPAGPPRDTLRVPVHYRAAPGQGASQPFDPEDTR